MTPRRGDIFLVDFEPARPNEANKVRPAVIVSNEQANTYGTALLVVPLTSNIGHVYPFQLLLPASETGLQVDSKAQAELLRSVSRSRLTKRLADLTEPLLDQLDDRIRLQLWG